MDANVKKTVLRMIPYGLYVLTAKGKDDTTQAQSSSGGGGIGGMLGRKLMKKESKPRSTIFTTRPCAS